MSLLIFYPVQLRVSNSPKPLKFINNSIHTGVWSTTLLVYCVYGDVFELRQNLGVRADLLIFFGTKKEAGFS